VIQLDLCLDCSRHQGAGGSRGCCRSCYYRQWQHVKKGKTTWAALEAAGKCLPADLKARDDVALFIKGDSRG
jgi:hypothetical protein